MQTPEPVNVVEVGELDGQTLISFLKQGWVSLFDNRLAIHGVHLALIICNVEGRIY
jgi:hypothetical protein